MDTFSFFPWLNRRFFLLAFLYKIPDIKKDCWDLRDGLAIKSTALIRKTQVQLLALLSRVTHPHAQAHIRKLVIAAVFLLRVHSTVLITSTLSAVFIAVIK